MKSMLAIFWFLAAAGGVLASADRPTVEFHDNERIALIGNEFFERDQDRGYIETQLTSRFPDKNLTFRNLGYSGDTVWADARSLCAGWDNFGPPEQGFNRLKSLVREIKPTLIFVAYGMNESFDGPKGLDRFAGGLERMLEMLASASSGARIVLVSPIRHENLGPPLPDPAEHNKSIRLYIDAMRKVAEKHGYVLMDLYQALGDGIQSDPPAAYTSDGIHLTPYGYWRAAQAFESALGYSPRTWRVELRFLDMRSQAQGAKVERLQSMGGLGSEFGLKVTLADETLPLAPPPDGSPPAIREGHTLAGQERLLRITGLPQGGRFVLRSGEQTLASADSQQWAKGVHLHSGPAFNQEEQLRKKVVAKNFDFFNYWRPQNDTYILGYRKHEQGRNAVEIPRFEPLMQAKEAQIAKLRVPGSHTYVLTRE